MDCVNVADRENISYDTAVIPRRNSPGLPGTKETIFRFPALRFGIEPWFVQRGGGAIR